MTSEHLRNLTISIRLKIYLLVLYVKPRVIFKFWVFFYIWICSKNFQNMLSWKLIYRHILTPVKNCGIHSTSRWHNLLLVIWTFTPSVFLLARTRKKCNNKKQRNISVIRFPILQLYLWDTTELYLCSTFYVAGCKILT